MARVDYAEYYRQWAALLQAGLTLHASMLSFVKQRGPLSPVFARMATAIEEGETLSAAMERERRHFHFVDRALVQAGEASGKLDGVFTLLGTWKESERRLMRALYSGLAYPLFLVHACAFIAPIPPVLIAFFQGGDVPWGPYVRTVAAFLVPIYVVAALFFLVRMPRLADTPLKKYLDQAFLRVPVLGTALRDLALSRYTFAFHALYEAGAPFLEVAELSERACGNARVAEALAYCREAARRGDSFAGAMTDRLLPHFFTSVWESGEIAGSLKSTLKRLAAQCADRAEFSLKQLSTWLPRVVYFVVAVYMAYTIIQMYMGHYAPIMKELSDVGGGLSDLGL